MSAGDGPVSLVICGLGGQGVLFLTRLLGEAAGWEGREVITCETHGMAQRGGAVASHVRIGGSASPRVRRGRAHAALVLDPGQRPAGEAWLAPGGRLFLDSAARGGDACDATGLAARLGASRAGNLVLVGFARRRAPDLFPSREALAGALERLVPPESLSLSLRALAAGEEAA